MITLDGIDYNSLLLQRIYSHFQCAQSTFLHSDFWWFCKAILLNDGAHSMPQMLLLHRFHASKMLFHRFHPVPKVASNQKVGCYGHSKGQNWSYKYSFKSPIKL
jgi:hypothetical protein